MKPVNNPLLSMLSNEQKNPSISVSKLRVSYHSTSGSQDLALHEMNFSIQGPGLIIFAGASGSGKSTLARTLIGLIPRFIKARVDGKILLNGKNLEHLSRWELTRIVGYVPQYPADFVTSLQVEEEIAFPLENLGFPPKKINELLNLTCRILNLEELRRKLITWLSAGELQRVELATALVTQPPILVLDEPFARIDSASESQLALLLKTLSKKGHLVLVFEHKLDHLLPLADEVIVLENGRMITRGVPTEILAQLQGIDLPEICRLRHLERKKIYMKIEEVVQSLRPILSKHELPEWHFKSSHDDLRDESPNFNEKKMFRSLLINSVTCTYPHSKIPAISDLSLKVTQPQIIGILGSNGSGKTTLLKLITGFIKPRVGEIIINEKRITTIKNARKFTCFVPENAKLFLVGTTPLKDLTRILKNQREANEIYDSHDFLSSIKNQKSYHLSEGQRRLVAIYNAFHVNKPVLLFDEPTIGLDAKGRNLFQELSRRAKNEGKTVIVATNDSRLFPFFDQLLVLQHGKLILQGTPRAVLYQLKDTTDLNPNQTITLTKRLEQEIGKNMPSFLNIDELNEFLSRLK